MFDRRENAPPQPPASASAQDIALAARLTLSDIPNAASICRLAFLYRHVADPKTNEIAYTSDGVCYYGPIFTTLNRHQKAAVVAHETLHNALGHVLSGALLFKRFGERFSFLVYNIACDAIINEILARLPETRRSPSGPSVAVGIESLDDFGIVRWQTISNEALKYCKEHNIQPDPIFTKSHATELTSTQIYIALMKLVEHNQAKADHSSQTNKAKDTPDGSEQDDTPNTDGQPETGQLPERQKPRAHDHKPRRRTKTSSNEPQESFVDCLARITKAHEDLRNGIETAAQKTTGELEAEENAAREQLRSLLAGIGSQDALRAIRCTEDRKTPWERILRRTIRRSLLTAPRLDPTKPSKRSINALAQQILTNRDDLVPLHPRLNYHSPARRLAVILDTSGSVFSNTHILERFLGEIQTIVRTTQSDCTVLMADDQITDEFPINDMPNRVQSLHERIKGGGGTSFIPAIERAIQLNADCAVYLTDLVGSFPDKPPPFPIWWVCPESSNVKPPFGRTIQIDI